VLAVCGVGTQSARDTFINVEGLDTLDAFATLNGDSDVTEMAKHMASRSATAGRVILGSMQIKRIQPGARVLGEGPSQARLGRRR
jgi:hypothetical protein